MRNYVDIAKILSQSSHCDLEFFLFITITPERNLPGLKEIVQYNIIVFIKPIQY